MEEELRTYVRTKGNCVTVKKSPVSFKDLLSLVAVSFCDGVLELQTTAHVSCCITLKACQLKACQLTRLYICFKRKQARQAF